MAATGAVDVVQVIFFIIYERVSRAILLFLGFLWTILVSLHELMLVDQFILYL